MSLIKKARDVEIRILDYFKEKGWTHSEIGGKTDMIPLMYLLQARYDDIHDQMPIVVTKPASRLSNYSLAVVCEITKPVTGPIYFAIYELGELLSMYRDNKALNSGEKP